MREHFMGEVLWRHGAFVEDPASIEVKFDWQPGHVRLCAKQPRAYGGGSTEFLLNPEEIAALISALRETQQPWDPPTDVN